MWFRRVLILLLISLALIVGRQVWSVGAESARDAVAADVVLIQAANTPKETLEPLENIDLQISKLRTLAYACSVTFKCWPPTSLHFLDLERDRITMFRHAMTLADKIRNADRDAPETDILRFELMKDIIEYHQLLPEIDAAKQGVPSEIAQALDPLH